MAIKALFALYAAYTTRDGTYAKWEAFWQQTLAEQEAASPHTRATIVRLVLGDAFASEEVSCLAMAHSVHYV